MKGVLARLDWALGTKEIACNILANYYHFLAIPFSKPQHRRVDKVPFLPTEQEIDQLIAACSKRVGSYIQTVKKTGARAGEVWNTRWTDLDLEHGTVRLTPEKNSNARMLKLSLRLCELIGHPSKVWKDGMGRRTTHPL